MAGEIQTGAAVLVHDGTPSCFMTSPCEGARRQIIPELLTVTTTLQWGTVVIPIVQSAG